MVTKYDFFDGECHAQKGHGDYVKGEDYEALKADRDAQQKRADALAVENMAIKAMNDCLSEELRGYESDGAFEGPHMHLLWLKAETPATDAALAAIEVRGVEKFAQRMHEKMEGLDPIKLPAYAEEIDHLISQLYAFATELREAK